MQILTPENKSYNLDRVPNYVDDVRYCIFNTNSDSKDYFWVPLTFIESYETPSALLQIGPHKIQMPLDWSIIVCDEHYTEVEAIPITSLNDRGYFSFAHNPLRHLAPDPLEISISAVWASVHWYVPRLTKGAVLAVPLEEGESPKCAYFVKEEKSFPADIEPGAFFE